MAAKNGRKTFLTMWQMTVYSLWVEIFFNISLSRTVSEINAFLPFTQKFKMAGKIDFWQKVQYDCM